MITGNRISTVYDCLIKITDSYLGPASRRFIDRQIINHLHKDPEDLTIEDLKNLIDWIRVVVALLTEDKALIEEYIAKIEMLNFTSRSNGSKAI